MKLQIKATNIVLTDPLKEFIVGHVNKLDKFLGGEGGPVSASVEVGRSTRHHKTSPVMFAEVNIRLGGQLLRDKKFGRDVRVAMGEVCRELEITIQRMKERKQVLERRGARSVKKFLKLSPLARMRKSRVARLVRSE